MTKPTITLFVDSVSPFAYLAFYTLRNFDVFKQCDIDYVPIFLGGLMHKCGNPTPISITNKDKWIGKERLTWARKFDIPMCDEMPEGFPINTINTQRALTVVHMEQPDRVADVLAALYKALWEDRKPINKPEVVVPILVEVLSISEDEAKAMFARGGKPEAKSLLAQNTDRAFDQGAFGLPWFVATNSKGERESFWGFDHLAQLIDHLGLERPTNNRGFKSLL